MSILLENLPDDWDIIALGDIDIRKAAALTPKNFADETFEYYSIPDYQRDQTPSLTAGYSIESSKLLLEPKTVLFGKLNPRVEKVWRVAESSEFRQIGSTEWIPIFPDERVDSDFLYFLEWSDHVMPIAKTLVSGSTPSRQRVDPKSFYRLRVPLPPLLEQKKIAHVLSTVQRAIGAQERIIQTTTELKKTLMHKLFTEGTRGEPQKQTEIGPVPESWEVKELGEFFEIKHGFAFDGKFFEPSGEHILMTPGHFNEEGGFRDQVEKTKYYTGEIPEDYLLAKDDLVVAMTEQKSGLLGSAAFVPEDDRYLHNQRLGLIVDLDTKRLSKRFLFNVFNTPHLRVEVAKTSTGSKVKHTSPTKLRAVKVGIPPTLKEQEEIATALATTERKIAVAKGKKAQLQDLFHTLLHELMTAKIRVHDLNFQEK